MPEKVIDPLKQVTDPVLLSALVKWGIGKDYVEFFQDYAPRKLGKEHSPTAKFYRDLISGRRFAVFSGLPMVDAEGVKIEAGWRVAGINYFAEKNNLFWAKVQGTDVELRIRNDQPDGRKANDRLSYKPQLFLGGVEQIASTPTLLALDPLNSSKCGCHPSQPAHYVENTLEWDFGIFKRRQRIIEGWVIGSWVIPARPSGVIRAKYNQTGDFRLRLGHFAISDDEEQITPDQCDELAKFQGGYPITISDSLTLYPDPHIETTTVDGYVQAYTTNDDKTWATLHDQATADQVHDSETETYLCIQCRPTSPWWSQLYRDYFLFDKSALPGNATNLSAVFSLRGSIKADTGGWDMTGNIYSGVPTSNIALAAGDYDLSHFGADIFCDTAISYTNWLVDDPYWNNFTLNAAGLAALAGDIVQLGFRNVNYDVANSAPAWASARISYMGAYTAEKGNGYKPKLVIAYTIPSAAKRGWWSK